MSDFDLTANLAAWRFVGWTGLAFGGLLILDYAIRDWARHSTPYRMFLLGTVGVFEAFGAHQFFWWRNENLRSIGNCLSTDIDYRVDICRAQFDWASMAVFVMPFAYIGLAACFCTMLPPLIRMRCGYSWEGAVAVTVIWLVGAYLVGARLAAG